MSIFNNNCLNKIRIPIRKKSIGVKSGEFRDHLIVTLHRKFVGLISST